MGVILLKIMSTLASLHFPRLKSRRAEKKAREGRREITRGKKKHKTRAKTRRRERDTDSKHCVGEIQAMQRLAGTTKEAEGRKNLWVKSNDKKAESDGEMDEEKKHKRG